MKDTIGLLVCLLVYTVTFFWAGMLFQRWSDQMQVRKFTNEAFTDGCKKCAEFEKLECERDQLQGQEGVTRIK